MAVQARSEIDVRYTWDLTRLFENDEAWEAEFTAIQTMAEAFAGRAGTLSEGEPAILETLGRYEEMQRRLETLYVYAMMRQNEDTGVTRYQAMLDRSMTLYTAVMTATAFLGPEIQGLPKKTIRALEKNPAFEPYARTVQEFLRMKPHTLNKDGERLLAMAGDALSTPDAASEMLRSLDLRLGTTRDENGGQAPLTDASFILFLESPDRIVRRLAFNNMMTRYALMGNTFAILYAGEIKAEIFRSQARHFPNCRAASMFAENVPESVYDSLIEAVHGGLGTLKAYLRLRRQKIGVPTLHMYDLYYGNEKSFEIRLNIEDAFDLFLRAVAPLGEDYVRDAGRALSERWLDVFENRGKRSGAYSCGSAYGVTPYVLLNYKENYDGISTICHEMGHAMHSFYSNLNQPYLNADYSIFVAEVASTTNEILLNEYLRKQYKDDKAAQIALVGSLLEHFRTTVFRQTLFAEFEMKAHQLAEAGESLTQEKLSETYYDIVKTYYGGACVVDKSIASEWMRIPHFYSPFYVYKYATSFCVAIALAQNILSGDPEKVASYRRFLTLGSSLPPIEELKVAGVDISTPEPVCQALDYFAELVLCYQELLA